MLDDDALLRATDLLDHNAPEVRDFVTRALQPSDGDSRSGGDSEIQRAVKLYYAVRDGLFYEVYGADLSREGMKASAILRRGGGFCMHKSIVYAAAVRAVGIPSRIVLGDVRNHLASERLKELVGGDVFHHCLTSVFLNGRWVKATPVFNKRLCRLYRIQPLEFDGLSDSLYHPHDEVGHRHMEFIRMHGEWDDFPYDRVIATMKALHPRLLEQQQQQQQQGGGHSQRGVGTRRGSLIAEAQQSA